MGGKPSVGATSATNAETSIFALFAYGQAAIGVSLHFVERDARTPPDVDAKQPRVDDNGKVQR